MWAPKANAAIVRVYCAISEYRSCKFQDVISEKFRVNVMISSVAIVKFTWNLAQFCTCLPTTVVGCMTDGKMQTYSRHGHYRQWSATDWFQSSVDVTNGRDTGCVPKFTANAGSAMKAVSKFIAARCGSTVREQWRHKFCRHFLLWLLRLNSSNSCGSIATVQYSKRAYGG